MLIGQFWLMFAIAWLRADYWGGYISNKTDKLILELLFIDNR